MQQVWASYAPVKNSPADAAAKAKEGNPTHSATTGETDIYRACAEMLQLLAGAWCWCCGCVRVCAVLVQVLLLGFHTGVEARPVF